MSASVVNGSVDHKLIPVDWIDEDPIAKDSPCNFSSPSTVSDIVQSFGRDGQVHAILVCKSESEGRFKIVAGRKRLAAAKRLKWDLIRAEVIWEVISASEIENLVLAENIFRHSPKESLKLALALKRWSEIWDKTKEDRPLELPKAKQPEDTRIPTPKTEAAPAAPIPIISVAVPPTASAPPESPPEPTVAAPKAESESASKKVRRGRGNAKQVVASTLGVSTRTASRLLSVANKFTESQLAALDAAGVTQDDAMSIASIEDDGARGQALNLLVSGMPIEKAIAEACPGHVIRPQGGPRSQSSDDSADAALSDAEWLSTHCGEIRSRLADTSGFDCSAIIYRRLSQPRREFSRKAVPVLSEAAASYKSIGMFGRLVRRIASVSHPRDWLVCVKCNGKGRIVVGVTQMDSGPCVVCGGDGFKVKEEQ